MSLNNLPKRKLRQLKSKRIGRGIGSGKGGHTVGKGTKGQNSRGKGHMPAGFEGGQVALFKKIPKLSGFKNHRGNDIIAVPLSKFIKIKEGTKVNPKLLLKNNVLKRLPKHGVKILKDCQLNTKLEFENFLYSKTAKEEIEKSGSTIL